MIDLNKFAKEVTLKEGKKTSVSIGQIKEVIKLTLKGLKKLTLDELTELLNRLR